MSTEDKYSHNPLSQGLASQILSGDGDDWPSGPVLSDQEREELIAKAAAMGAGMRQWMEEFVAKYMTEEP